MTPEELDLICSKIPVGASQEEIDAIIRATFTDQDLERISSGPGPGWIPAEQVMDELEDQYRKLTAERGGQGS